MVQGIERRAHPRRDVHVSVLVASGVEEGGGWMANISLSGALIDPSTIRPRLGAPVKVRFQAYDEQPAEVVGTVVRHSPGGFAIRFSETNAAVRELVEHGRI